jgi:hypothetical protein
MQRPEGLCYTHHAADLIGALPRLDERERAALAILLLGVVYCQDNPRDRRTLEVVRDAVCTVLDSAEPGLVTKVPVH